jgi:hypothetical protein
MLDLSENKSQLEATTTINQNKKNVFRKKENETSLH